MIHSEQILPVDLAIADVYAAFADAPRPTSIDGCPCCVDGKEIDELLSKPLRELEPDIVGPYASSVFLTIGDTRDYFYLLPRILEILATEPQWWPDPQVVGRSIRDSGYSQWPEKRQAAVRRYLDAVFERILNSNADISGAGSWLCMLAIVGFDLRPSLEKVLSRPDHVAELFMTLNKDVVRGQGLRGFWEYSLESAKLVEEWLHSDPVRRIVHEKWGVTL
jgi:hypothetical protein